MEDIDSIMEDQKFHLDKGDSMLLYTDGITEAWEKNQKGTSEREANNLFGEKKLLEMLKSNGKKKPEKLKKLLLDELKNYKSDDDITFIIIKRVR